MWNSARSAIAFLAIAWGSIVLADDAHVHGATSSEQVTTDNSFSSEVAGAMERMHHDMAAVPIPSGDPDRDFAAMMIPHHQGAVDMARGEIQYGKDPVLRRLAQAIIVEQIQEINLMQRRLGELQPLPAEQQQTNDANSTDQHKNIKEQ